MKQQFEKIRFNQALQGNNEDNNDAQTIDPQVSANNQDIVILCSWYVEELGKISNAIEKCNIVEGTSTELPWMNFPSAASVSCVHNNDVIVTRGFDGYIHNGLFAKSLKRQLSIYT